MTRAAVDGTDEVTAKTSVTYTASGLYNNGFDIGTSADSTAFTATLNGGAKNETFRIDGNTKQSSITLKGNVGAGTNSVAINLADTATATTDVTVDLSAFVGSDKASTTTTTTLTAEATNNITFKGSAMNDTIVMGTMNSAKTLSITDATTTDSDTLFLDGSAGAVVATKLSLSGIEVIKVNDSNTSPTINASAINGQKIDLISVTTGDILTLTGTADADTIDLSLITTSDATKEVGIFVTGSAGNDNVVLSTAGVSIETVSFVASNGSDNVTAFKVGEDLINVKTAAGTITSKVAVAANDAQVANATDAAAYVFANGADGTGTAAITSYTTMSQVVAFLVAGLAGTTDAENYVAVINDLLTNKSYVYAVDVNAVTTVADTIEVGDVTLIGTITADAALTTTQVVFA